jgi:hypothetical protein
VAFAKKATRAIKVADTGPPVRMICRLKHIARHHALS